MFTLNDVVPWGRSFDEYRRMFAMSNSDLSRHILGCADGPASFNAQLTETGGKVISCSLTRVALDVRIFPLTELENAASRHIAPVTAALREDGCQVAVETVDYEFQKGGNQMLIIFV